MSAAHTYRWAVRIVHCRPDALRDNHGPVTRRDSRTPRKLPQRRVETLVRSMHTPVIPKAHRSTVAPVRTHDTRREGVALGLVVATAIWAWLALVDLLAGEPFHTFTTLGGVTAFTIAHYLLNVAYAVIIVAAIHGAVRQPSLIIALAFGFVMVQFVFAMLSAVFSNLGLGQLAWIRIFGGSLVGGAITFAILARKHPLAAQLRRAEEEV
jgi:hypothetical protein